MPAPWQLPVLQRLLTSLLERPLTRPPAWLLDQQIAQPPCSPTRCLLLLYASEWLSEEHQPLRPRSEAGRAVDVSRGRQHCSGLPLLLLLLPRRVVRRRQGRRSSLVYSRPSAAAHLPAHEEQARPDACTSGVPHPHTKEFVKSGR